MNLDDIYTETKEIRRIDWNPEIIKKTVDSYIKVKTINGNVSLILENLKRDAYQLYVGHLKFLQTVFEEKLMRTSDNSDAVTECIQWAVDIINQLKSFLVPLDSPEEVNKLTNKCVRNFTVPV